MFYKISRFFLYLSLLTPLLLIKSMFFPFIAGKAMFFRGMIELALLFFLFHILANLQRPEFVQQLLKKLKHPIVICLAVFTLAIIVTALTGAHPGQSFWSNFERGDGAFQILHYALFCILALVTFTDKESLLRLLLRGIMLSIPMSAYALMQLFSTDANNPFIVAPGARVSGTLGNPSYLAAYLIFILVFILYLLIKHRGEIKQYATELLVTPLIGWIIVYAGLLDWSGTANTAANDAINKTMGWSLLWYAIAAVILYILSTIDKKRFQTITLSALFLFNFFILLKTGTRGAFLAIIAGILVVAAINFVISKNKRTRLTLGVVFAGIIALSGIFFATHRAALWAHIPVLNRLVNFTSATTDIKPRIWTWGSGLAATIERPLLGWGVEGFAVPFDKYYNPNHYGIESFFDRTHNIFLEYSVSGGLLVLLSWLAIFYYYYRRLERQPKDLWYSILFATPIMYLVQGFFLFDTLPIYLAFFIFLTLVINTETDATHLAPNPQEKLQGVNIATAGLLVVGAAMLMYQTLYLPLQKNSLLVAALMAQGQLSASAGTPQAITPMQVVDQYHEALSLASPIGQEETIGSYQKFVLGLIENASQNQQLINNPQVRKEVRTIVDDVNAWFDNNQAIFPGLKEVYINGGMNLRAGISYGQTDLLARGKQQYLSALAIAPTRLEFISVLIQLAKVQGDTEALEKWGRQAELLRPDLFSLAALKK